MYVLTIRQFRERRFILSLFITFVKRRREELGLTQAELAEKCVLSRVSVGNIEKKQKVGIKKVEQILKFETLVKLAKGLELPIIELMKLAKGYESIEILLGEVKAYNLDYMWFEKLGRYEKQVVTDFAEFLVRKKV